MLERDASKPLDLNSLVSILGLNDQDSDVDSESMLRKLNNLDFKLEMQSQSCVESLNSCCQQAIQILSEPALEETVGKLGVVR